MNTSYHDDMVTTSDLDALLERVNETTKQLQRSTTVPDEVGELVDSFESVLAAPTPLQLNADPYLTTTLWAAAFRLAKALRRDNTENQRRDVRIALEQFRHALRDIIDNRPYTDDIPINDVLASCSDTLSAPQKTLAELLGVSVRQLQRWLSNNGSEPTGDDAARIRAVARIVNQLRHTFTGPGVVAWFEREHPSLKQRPIDLLKDPLGYPDVLSAATASRATAA